MAGTWSVAASGPIRPPSSPGSTVKPVANAKRFERQDAVTENCLIRGVYRSDCDVGVTIRGQVAETSTRNHCADPRSKYHEDTTPPPPDRRAIRRSGAPASSFADSQDPGVFPASDCRCAARLRRNVALARRRAVAAGYQRDTDRTELRRHGRRSQPGPHPPLRRHP